MNRIISVCVCVCVCARARARARACVWKFIIERFDVIRVY